MYIVYIYICAHDMYVYVCHTSACEMCPAFDAVKICEDAKHSRFPSCGFDASHVERPEIVF